MRILVITQYFWPENFRINDLVGELVERGHKVTVLTGKPNYPTGKVFDAYRENPSEFSEYLGADVRRVPLLPRGNCRLQLALNYVSFILSACILGPWLLRGIEADVVYVFGPSPVTVGLPAILVSKIKKAPIVFWVLDLWPESLKAVGAVKTPIILSSVGYMVRFIYNRCTLVLGQSRAFLGSIANYCSDSTKIRYFPSWAEDVFEDESIIPAPELSKSDSDFLVMFAGNIGEAQDMPAVLDAVEQLKNNAAIRWVIVGDGRKLTWLQFEIAQRGLRDRVTLLGTFPVEYMPSLYVHADALLVSLKREPVFSMTIPGKVQSYLMSGIPILGMLDGEGAAVINDANAGITCAAGDSNGLAQAVIALLTTPPEIRRQMGLNGRKYAQQEFGRTQLMEYLEELLVEAVSIQETKAANKV